MPSAKPRPGKVTRPGSPSTVESRDRRDHRLQKTYGINSKQYSHLLARQGGGCAICGRIAKTRALNVDHCHRTGLVRGVLCHSCNRGLPFFRDNPGFLRKAAEYLETSEVRRKYLDEV